jgi:hypothetical protein
MASKKDLDQLVRGVGGTARHEKGKRGKADEIVCIAPGGTTWDGENDVLTFETTNDAVAAIQDLISAGGPREMERA